MGNSELEILIDCVWENDNAFYWRVQLFDVRKKGIMFKKKHYSLIDTYKYGEFEYAVRKATELSKDDLYIICIDKRNL